MQIISITITIKSWKNIFFSKIIPARFSVFLDRFQMQKEKVQSIYMQILEVLKNRKNYYLETVSS